MAIHKTICSNCGHIYETELIFTAKDTVQYTRRCIHCPKSTKPKLVTKKWFQVKVN